MTTRLTLFTATLVQDSALSVSGLNRETSADQPFALVESTVDGVRTLVPALVGRGLKGAAVAMAKRFFDPLPGAVSDALKEGEKRALRRSAWEFSDATTTGMPALRAGVGIRQKTGARADGVLYDREVIPAGTRWQLSFRVDRSYALDDAEFTEAEGILGYVLAEHWAKGRCWLGGGAARGLGWCHIEDLKAYRFDATNYEAWVKLGRSQSQLPTALAEVPVVSPTRSWCFRTLDLKISFGEYKPEPDDAAWGLDMFAVGPHDSERPEQPTGDGLWTRPAWATNTDTPDTLNTDRALLMDGQEGEERPLLPAASVRGPLRHAFSRMKRAAGHSVEDPNRKNTKVSEDDPAGKAFGTVNQSSRILICDARAEQDWSAAKLHMHAEDEFSASTYGKSKRDAVRLLAGHFPVRIVIEGATPEEVEPLVAIIDRQVALGTLGHLPVGGHKTRGAGWGQWQPKPWVNDDVIKARDWTPPQEREPASQAKRTFIEPPADCEVWVQRKYSWLESTALTLDKAAEEAKVALGAHRFVTWWCEPTIDLNLTEPPATFGRTWPEGEHLQVDEVTFYAERAVWRAARTSSGVRWVFIEEVTSNTDGAEQAYVVHIPARLHADQRRFSSANTGPGNVLLRKWYVDGQILGFTVTKEQR